MLLSVGVPRRKFKPTPEEEQWVGARAEQIRAEMDRQIREYDWPDDGLPLEHFVQYVKGYEGYDDAALGTAQYVDPRDLRVAAAAMYQQAVEQGDDEPTLETFHNLGWANAVAVDMRSAGFDVDGADDVKRVLNTRAFRRHKKQQIKQARKELAQDFENRLRKRRADQEEDRVTEIELAILEEIGRYQLEDSKPEAERVVRESWTSMEPVLLERVYLPYDGEPPPGALEDFTRGRLPDGSTFEMPPGVFLRLEDLFFDRAMLNLYDGNPPPDILEIAQKLKREYAPSRLPYLPPRPR